MDMSELFGSGDKNGGALPESRSVTNGIEIATVVNIKDPKNYGRVKCKYVTSDKDAGETGWIYCMTPFGGDQYGSFFHPNVGDVVVLAFQHGDIHRPFVIGRLWTQEVKPPLNVQNGKNEEYKIVTPNQSYLDFVDTKGKEKITLATPKGRTVLLDDENGQISISDGKTSLVMNEQNGTTEITCDKKLVVKVGTGVTITCDGTSGAVTIKTNKEVAVSTAQYSNKASGTSELSANGSMTVKSSGMLTVKGSMTKIN